MAVAAYASVLSLLRVVDNIQHPSRLRLFPDTGQIDALREKLCSLQHLLELHSSTITEDVECMVRKIPKVAKDAEILIDKYVVDQLCRELYPQNGEILQNFNRLIQKMPRVIQKISHFVYRNLQFFHYRIHRVIEKIESINKALKTLQTTQHDQEQPGRVPDKFTGHKPLKTKMMGFDDQLNEVLEKLIGNKPNLVVIPIVGMGGIGKTTLARSLFDHSYNLHHFSVRIWLTISQDYNVKKVLQGLLKDGVLEDKKDIVLRDESEAELITQLHQKLFGQRYLIVLDDVWSAEAWDDLRRGFPDNGKGSRVIVTTRLSEIASSLDSGNNDTYSMKFLDENKSWNLFCEKAFEQGGRSFELEKIGREISKRCKGLPMLLAVVGGLLANSNMSVEYWQIVEKHLNSLANSANDEYCFRILSLSYHHLPIHLKPCFLYMRHFEEDSYIEVSDLIKRWVSQGFVKPMRGKNLEEAAKKYLEDLVGRNMFLIRKRRKNGNIKVCGVHDLLRDVSIKESHKEQLLELPKMFYIHRDINGVCVICNERKTDLTSLYPEALDSDSNGKILACSSCQRTFPELKNLRFVKAVGFKYQNVPLLTTCRSIALFDVGRVSVFHTIRLIWNLELLDIVESAVVAPKELWEMPHLRHVKLISKLSDPVSTKSDVIVLENLNTLTTVEQLKFTEEIVRRIPNLRKLGVSYDNRHFSTYEEEDWSCFYLQNLSRLQKLESLSIICNRMVSMNLNVIAFPCSLKELTLEGCNAAWEDLTVIGSLPNLEMLILNYRSVLGEEWNPIEGEFLRLKYLKLRELDLVHWSVNGTHFPVLETLFLSDMKLREFPPEVGELPALNSIHLEWCSENIIDSALDVVKGQLINGIEGLVVHFKDEFGWTFQFDGADLVLIKT